MMITMAYSSHLRNSVVPYHGSDPVGDHHLIGRGGGRWGFLGGGVTVAVAVVVRILQGAS